MGDWYNTRDLNKWKTLICGKFGKVNDSKKN